MAYRFNGTTDFVEFALGGFNGFTIAACTIAVLMKLNSTAAAGYVTGFNTSTGTNQWGLTETPALNWLRGGSQSLALTTTPWYLLACSKPGGSTLARWHVHDGTSWTHVASDAGVASDRGILSTDLLRVGGRPTNITPLPADIVCIGIKLADSTDLQIQTLSRTSFSAWTAFGFHWLIGFDSSLVVGGLLQDQGSVGTSDETSRSGTSLVADVPGWTSWGAGGAAVFVPQITIVG